MPDFFTVELKGVKEALAILDPKKLKLATNRALNRVAGSGKTEASRGIRQEYNIKAARINQFLRLSVRARGANSEATITGRGLGIALAYFDARQKGYKLLGEGAGKMRTKGLIRSGRKRSDVTVRVKRSSGRKIVNSKYGNKPFLAQMKSGHIGVFVRTGKGKKPIEQLLGPGVGGLFGSRKIIQAVKSKILKMWAAEFTRQLNYYFKRR